MKTKRAAKPMGRPPISPDGVKDAVLLVRMSSEEKATIERAAARDGVSTSEWVRAVLLAEAGDSAGT